MGIYLAAYTQAGREIDRPTSENGMHVDGPLTAEDWKLIVGFILDELSEQAYRDGWRDALIDRIESDGILK